MKQTETSLAPVGIRSDKPDPVRVSRPARSGPDLPIESANPAGLTRSSYLRHHTSTGDLIIRTGPTPYLEHACRPVCPATIREARRCAY